MVVGALVVEGALVVVGFWVEVGRDGRTLVTKRVLDDTVLRSVLVTTVLVDVEEVVGSTEEVMGIEVEEEVTTTEEEIEPTVNEDDADWAGSYPAPITGPLDPETVGVGIGVTLSRILSSATNGHR